MNLIESKHTFDENCSVIRSQLDDVEMQVLSNLDDIRAVKERLEQLNLQPTELAFDKFEEMSDAVLPQTSSDGQLAIAQDVQEVFDQPFRFFSLI